MALVGLVHSLDRPSLADVLRLALARNVRPMEFEGESAVQGVGEYVFDGRAAGRDSSMTYREYLVASSLTAL